MGFRYRRPSIKIGGTTIRKNKNGYSISGKTLFGGRKTYNTATGKTTTTYQTGIKGLSYQTVSGGKKKKADEAKKGCYIATAVYGSYDCPEVWTLRRYRDNNLAETRHGRAFIRIYYTISPILVKWFGHTEWFKRIWKSKLNRMVANLNAKGIKNSPYKD